MSATGAGPLPAPVAALADPALHGCAPETVAVRETHASWVVLAGDRAYKVKKPVAFAFLDQSTLARRRAACAAEVALNRELAPGIYLGVRALVPAGDGGALRLADGEDPAAVEYAVEMRRFDERATLAALARSGTLGDEALRAVARRLVAFHRTAPRAAAPRDPAGAAAAALARLDRNGEELLALLPGAPERRRVLAQVRCMAAFVAARAERLAGRAAAGLVRDLHGDLRAAHVLPGPPVRCVDRLEFSRSLREIDVADEVAFLAMDVTALGAPWAARTLLAAYRDAGGDAGEDRLVAWHAVYRAQVRAKVALLRARQGDGGAAAGAEAAALLAVAERFAWAVRGPRVLVVCGPSASGKSRLAAELAARSGRPVVSSDIVRKRDTGLPLTARAGAERYADPVSARTYRRLAVEAAAAPDGAIVDATFRRRVDRAAFASALPAALAGEVAYARCVAPAGVLRERARRRMADPARVSDATPELALAQLAAFEPLEEVPAGRLLPLRTDRAPARIADTLAAALDELLAAEG